MPNYYITEGYSKMKITKEQIKKIIQEEIEGLLDEGEKLKLDLPPAKTPKVSYGTVGGGFKNVLRQIIGRILRNRVGADDLINRTEDTQTYEKLKTLGAAKRLGQSTGDKTASIKNAKLRRKYGHMLPKLTTLDEVEPIPRNKVPHVHMIDEAGPTPHPSPRGAYEKLRNKLQDGEVKHVDAVVASL